MKPIEGAAVDRLIFSQSAIFRLQQLARHLHRQTGARYKLSTTQGIVNLLNASSETPSPNIRHRYAAFVNELNEEQIKALAEEGLLNEAAPMSRVLYSHRTG